MVHCITLAVPVSGLHHTPALDWYSQGDTVDNINPRSVLCICFQIFLHENQFPMKNMGNYRAFKIR